jgi:LysR family transcriptional regulator for bpeEF and oprC
MDRLKAIEIFQSVAARQSFTRAADALGLSTPVVSRAVQELEQLLGVRLLQRSTRRVVLTREGEDVLARAGHLLDAFEELAATSRQNVADVAGPIRFTAPASWGAARVAPLVAAFIARHPRVHIDLLLTDAPLALDGEGVDLALRVADRLPEHLVARRVAELAIGIYAAPAYLQRKGLPRHPEALSGHDCVLHSGHAGAAPWQFLHPVTQHRTAPVLRRAMSANDAEAVMAAAVHGAGLAQLPRAVADAAVARGELQPVLGQWTCPPLGLYLVYRERRHQPVRVRKLIEHLVGAFEGPDFAAERAAAQQPAPLLMH